MWALTIILWLTPPCQYHLDLWDIVVTYTKATLEETLKLCKNTLLWQFVYYSQSQIEGHIGSSLHYVYSSVVG